MNPSSFPLVVGEPWDFGLGLHGTLWQAKKPVARLLLLHGYGEYSERYVTHYHSLIPSFVASGISVYAYDQQGHGHSGGKRGNVEHLLQDHLHARRALEGSDIPFFLYGHSMGGTITAASVLERPEGIDGVILSSPALLLGVKEPRWLTALAPILMKYCPDLPVRRLPKRDLFQNNSDNGTLWIPASTAASLLMLTKRLWPRYGQWRVPTLIFHGTADRLADIEGSQRLIKLIHAPEKTYLEIEGGFHELLNDPQAEILHAQLLTWLMSRIQT